MTDVVEIANNRRIRLAAEIGKLDDFLRMAEALMKDVPLETAKAPEVNTEKAAKSNGSVTARTNSAVAEKSGVDVDDYAVRELKVEEKMFGSLTKHTEPGSDRQGLFRRATT